jgi:Flp pilus assembly protein TadD
MRFGRWSHVAVFGAAASVARVSAGTPDTPDIPDWSEGPAVFAVTPFENHVPNGKSLDWIVAEAPFEIAEKSENVLGLAGANAPLFVPGDAVPAEADTVAAFGAAHHARYVITGWFDKIGEDLRIDMIVWKLGKTATVAGESQHTGPVPSYHQIIGDVMADAWTKAGVGVDAAVHVRLTRVLAKDIYPVFMMGRGLGNLTGAIGKVDLKAAEHDLERSVFLDPKLPEAQRLLGELYLRQSVAGGTEDPKLVAKAAAKFNYATDLAPDDLAALRAAATATARSGKWELALELFRKLVTKRPWDLDARFELGRAQWQIGDAKSAEHQLEQVTAKLPDHLAARHVLVLIHSARGDTKRLVAELEAIAVRAPADLDVKSDLASAYGALAQWAKAIAALEQIAQVRPNDLALLVRVGDAHRKHGDLDAALAWYGRAAKLAPESSMPGFMIAQAQLDAGKLADAQRTYTNLQKYAGDFAAAEHALGVIAFAQGRADDAAWYLRKAVRAAPRELASRRAVIAAELMRRDAAAAQAQLEPALAAWPTDEVLHYLAGIAHVLAGETQAARDELQKAPGLAPARAALGALDAGGTAALDWKPEIIRPWGDGTAIAAALEHYGALANELAKVRARYQHDVVALLGAVGKGPAAAGKPPVAANTCPVGTIAPAWADAQQTLAHYARIGVELEATFRFVARHDELGLTASLLPNARLQVASTRRELRTSLADMGELRAELWRGVMPELRAIGCTDQLLAAAVADPSRYHIIEESKPEVIPPQAAPRAKPRSTFFVDNTGCPDPVDVYIDGRHVGQVAPGRRSALIADGGDRSLCLVGPGAAQCGDRGTVREVYLHDGWSVTMHCPK